MNCSICQDKIQSIKHNCVSTKCGHHFHCDCFLEFLEKNNGDNLCPICRKKIPFQKNTSKKMTNSLAIDIIFELFNDLDFEDYWNTSSLAEDSSIIRGYIINLMRSTLSSVQKFYEEDEETEESVYDENDIESIIASDIDIADEIRNENNLPIEENEQNQEQYSQILNQEEIEDINSIHSILNIYHVLSNHRSTFSIKEKID
jgi:hypothetical protein